MLRHQPQLEGANVRPTSIQPRRGLRVASRGYSGTARSSQSRRSILPRLSHWWVQGLQSPNSTANHFVPSKLPLGPKIADDKAIQTTPSHKQHFNICNFILSNTTRIRRTDSSIHASSQLSTLSLPLTSSPPNQPHITLSKCLTTGIKSPRSGARLAAPAANARPSSVERPLSMPPNAAGQSLRQRRNSTPATPYVISVSTSSPSSS